MPEADPLALSVRARLNPERPVPDLLGGAVFAHVSILGPFPPPAEIEGSTLEALEATCGRLDAFYFTLATLRVFAGGIAYLAPQPDGPFRELMQALSAIAFGRAEVPEERATPHVTLAVGMNTDDRLAALEVLTRPALPLTARASQIDVVFVESSRRTLVKSFPLRG